MIGTGAAMIGAGLLGAGASIFGANKAADAQKDAANQALAFQQQQFADQQSRYGDLKQAYSQAQTNFAPYMASGTGATNLLASFYGLNGTDPALGQNALAAFSNSPDYKFALQQGQSALDNTAAAKGGSLGGNQIRAQTDYAQGLATTNLGNYLSRLSGISGQGITAATGAGNVVNALGSFTNGANAVGASSANTIGNTMMAGGTADASGILGTVKGINSGLNSLSLYNQMGQSSYRQPTPLSSYSNGAAVNSFNPFGGGTY